MENLDKRLPQFGIWLDSCERVLNKRIQDWKKFTSRWFTISFLFIKVIEALHVTIQETMSKNIFEGVKVGSNISHLRYVDDALILGKWSLENGNNLWRTLRRFHLAFGLNSISQRVNYLVLVLSPIAHHLASMLCYQPSTLSCLFLHFPIGANMNKAFTWKLIIEKFHKRLTS